MRLWSIIHPKPRAAASPQPPRSARSRAGAIAAGVAWLFAAIADVGNIASAQPVFSLTFHGAPKGTPDFFGFPITEGDLLVPVSILGPPFFTPSVGPLPPVAIAVSGGFGPPAPGLALPAHPGAIGLPPGVMGMVELDAVSYGTDYAIAPTDTPMDIIWIFSVDEFAVGVAGSPVPPNVFTEGPAGLAGGSAKIFRDVATGVGPVCVPVPGGGNTLLYDCDGLAPPAGGYPGLIGPGPFEFNPPAPGVPDPGADIDALDVDPPPGVGPMGAPGYAFPIYYSLDAGFFNPVEGVPNSGSAAVNGGFFGGDILMCVGPGAPPVVYAPGFLLGVPGPMNDVDGLILWENGIPGYQPPTVPFSWVPGVSPMTTDMLFFSVRPGSAVIGAPDGMCGTPITPGDILWGPIAPGGLPRKWISSAQLALMPMDNIDALDLAIDCNGNNVPDNIEIATGMAADVNGNGIPDSCECPADYTGDGIVNMDDLLVIISGWGTYNMNNLLAVVNNWGACP